MMNRIIVHAFDDGGFDTRLEAGLQLARQTGAHLTLMHIRPDLTSTGEVYTAGLFVGAVPVSITEQMAKDEKAFRERCHAKMEREDVPWDWRVRAGIPEREFARESVLCDALVVSPIDAEYSGQTGETFVGRMVNAVGCPVLSAPDMDTSFADGGRILILWNGSEEAGRAVRDALPLLTQASHVRVLSVGPVRADRPDAKAVAAYLTPAARNVEVAEVPDGGDIADRIREEATSYEAGLIVMGAYGRSRLSEMILGGVTQSMIAQQRFPVFFSR